MSKFTTPEQFSAVAKANIETLIALANSNVARVERLSALNINTARAALEDGVAATKTLLAVKNPQDIAGLQASLAQPMMDKAVAYARSVYEIAAEAQQEVAKLFEAQVAELNKNVNSALEQAAKAAPAGSEPVFAAIESSMEAANSLYDNASKAVKQASEVAEANLAAQREALDQPADDDDDRCGHADRGIGRRDRHAERRHADHRERQYHHRPPSNAVAQPTDDESAERPGEEPCAERREGEKQAGLRVGRRKEAPSDLHREEAEDQEIVEFERIAERHTQHLAARDGRLARLFGHHRLPAFRPDWSSG